jgi:thiazole synthase ThiGH ThiG subunit
LLEEKQKLLKNQEIEYAKMKCDRDCIVQEVKSLKKQVTEAKQRRVAIEKQRNSELNQRLKERKLQIQQQNTARKQVQENILRIAQLERHIEAKERVHHQQLAVKDKKITRS